VFQASLFIWQGSIASTELNNFLWNDLSFFSGVMVNIGETDVTEPSVKNYYFSKPCVKDVILVQ